MIGNPRFTLKGSFKGDIDTDVESYRNMDMWFQFLGIYFLGVLVIRSLLFWGSILGLLVLETPKLTYKNPETIFFTISFYSSNLSHDPETILLTIYPCYGN